MQDSAAGDLSGMQEADLLRHKLHSRDVQLRQARQQIRQLEQLRSFQLLEGRRMAFRQLGDLQLLYSSAREMEWSAEAMEFHLGIILEPLTGGSGGIGNLVNTLNSLCDNALVHLQDDLPSLSEPEFRLYCYMAAGLDDDQIILLLGLDGPERLYSLRYRLRRRLRNLQCPRREIYLRLIRCEPPGTPL